MMKQPNSLYTLRMALVLALFCSFATSMAYDFEVDGIYYNKTSDTTVEVTYKNGNYASYSGDIAIPSSISVITSSNSQVIYTVTAIGDSAFYNSNVSEIIIPECVSSIGVASFKMCPSLFKVTCMALSPPGMNDSFDHHIAGYNFIPGPGDDYGEQVIKDHELFLYVPSVSYYDYKNMNETEQYFSFIIHIGAGATEPPIICELDDGPTVIPVEGEVHIYRLFCKIGPGGNNILLCYYFWWDDFEECDYSEDNGIGTYYSITYAYAVKEGFEPSQIVSYQSEDHSHDYDYHEEIWEEDSDLFDFVADGVCYNVIGNKTLSVAPDVHVHLLRGNEYYRNFTVHTIYPEDSEAYRYGMYEGRQIVIPSTVTYNGEQYNVTTLSADAFGDFFRIYQYEALSYEFYEIVLVEFWAMTVPCYLKSLTIPNSIISIVGIEEREHPFGRCIVNTLKLTGDGEWVAGDLFVEANCLLIASSLTSISGLNLAPQEVYCYSAVPPICDENTFTDYTGTLHVPESSLAAYFTAPYWCNFLNIVGDAVELEDLSIDMQTATLEVGCELNLSASVLPDNASVGEIEWTSSNDEVATVKDGLVTAKSKGECDIVATCLDKRAICHLTVTEVLPSSITLNQESVLLEMDSTFTLTALIAPENSTYKSVTWTSSDTLVATVSVDGVVTATGVGETVITASCKDLTVVCHVKVLERFIYITLDHHRESLLPNHILTLTPTVSPVPTSLVVTSSNPSVAAARLANGIVQVVGVAPGSAVIKVGSTDGNAFADSCFMTVYTQVGDVNCDGFIKINDVTTMIDYIFGVDLPMFDVGNADVDFDGRVTITDITVLIDLLLTNTSSQPSRMTYTVNGESFTMIRVAAGSFMMGATEEQGDDYTDREKPVHEVTLTSSYFIGETEVTQALWLAVMGTNPSKHTGDLNKPVENVTWLDCQEFITRLNALTGEHFRLPTEAEWEFAACGGNKSHGYKYAGSNNVDDVAWYTGETTHAVAMLQPNELYLYDMSGNVDEWINDYWYTYTSEPQTDPTGPESGTSHVYRGGSWYGGATASRVSCRMFRSETFQRGTLGLRLAL